MAKETDLVAEQPKSGFLALAQSDFATVMAEELDGLQLTFDRIKMPGAGGMMYEVPGDSDEPDLLKEFLGVMLYHHPMRCYYMGEYTGGNNPPNCGSYDGKTGIGTPGGSCADCPMNKYGTGKNDSKACKDKQRLYILREGEVFPLLLSLPTGSLGSFKRYIKRLLCKGQRPSTVVTRFSLKREQNKTQITYAQAQFAMERVLTAAEQPLIDSLVRQAKEYSKQVAFDNDTVSDDGTAGAYVDPETGEVIQPLTGDM